MVEWQGDLAVQSRAGNPVKIILNNAMKKSKFLFSDVKLSVFCCSKSSTKRAVCQK
jgi:hypothetical protein